MLLLMSGRYGSQQLTKLQFLPVNETRISKCTGIAQFNQLYQQQGSHVLIVRLQLTGHPWPEMLE